MTCSECGGSKRHLPGCPTQDRHAQRDKEVPKGQAGRRTRVLGNLSAKDADSWIRRMGTRHEGGKRRHYERQEDPENPGKFELFIVEDED